MGIKNGRASGGRGEAGPRVSLYDEVTTRIIGELEQGRIPWVKPWASGDASPCLPRNAASGRRYSGINVLLLWAASAANGWAQSCWLTFAQALALGGNVRKGERGTMIVYADAFVPRNDGGEHTGAAGEDARPVRFLKRFIVFNVAQCEGLPEQVAPGPADPVSEPVPAADRLIAASGIDYREGGDRAFYVPSVDMVVVPPRAAFFEPLDYYRILLHEFVHATGHPSRVGRTLTTDFGSRDYAREELIAELGSAFLCAALGIAPTLRHADYLAHWLDILKADNKAIVRAASAASRAADWLLARTLSEGRAEP
ncbi:zincin-like metallopeptidase domain-containing protein [Sphingomonas sp.]|uniref:ArdC family protein n=1 Tax=Sphingomonas sp. TaxID=28214 RepID=UPI0025EBA569|nr:zincin-like metallopeptidase domain-containing protein [Sphingomonas sp.]